MSQDWIDANEQDEYLIDYLFDLNGYVVIKNGLANQDLDEMNQWIDNHWQYIEGNRRNKNEDQGQWIGHVETHTYSDADGCNFQNIIEAGSVFRRLITYPTWIKHCRR